jgi:hypothetical protein
MGHEFHEKGVRSLKKENGLDEWIIQELPQKVGTAAESPRRAEGCSPK